MTALQIGMTAATTRRGGADRYFFDLFRALPPIGVELRGLVVGDPDDPLGAVRSFAAGDASMLRRWVGIQKAFASLIEDADLVASHFAAHTVAILHRIRSRPLVVHFHGPWKLENRIEGTGSVKATLQGSIESAVYRRAARLIVLSNAFGEILVREYGVARERIRVIPGGVDLTRFSALGSRADARRVLGWPLDRPTVVTVRRLVRSKGLERLVDAIDAVRKELPEILTIIVGTGPLAAELESRVRERRLGAHVRLSGHVPDDALPHVYRAADLCVVPSVALEGFGLVVLEALACGTPALVTPVGGMPEVVGPLAPALVLPDAGGAAIADGIVAALRGRIPLPDEQACREHAARFRWPCIAKRIKDVYDEVA